MADESCSIRQVEDDGGSCAVREWSKVIQPNSPAIAAEIGARLDRLPATRYIWKLVLLLSLGGCFEIYDLFFTAYIGPGLVRSGLFSSASASFFGFNGLASFVAGTFAGLFIGTMLFGFAADWFGRRMVFTYSLLWYTAATVIMAFRHTAIGIVAWRLIAGVGIGVELVTIDTYITELVPKHLRGRAFAVNQVIQFSVIPVVALLAWVYLQAQVTILAAELNTVLVHRLWPRSITQPPLTDGDKRAYEEYAKVERYRHDETVDVDFLERPKKQEQSQSA